MKKSSRMSPILRMEESRERNEAIKLAEQQRILIDKKAKLDELQGYLKEYRGHFFSLAKIGANGEQIRSHNAFIEQVGGAIGKQQKIVQEAGLMVEEQRQRWLDAKRRVDILVKTIEKMKKDELTYEEKREQKLADEAAVRNFRDK